MGIDEGIIARRRITPQLILAAVDENPRTRPLLEDPPVAVAALRERLRGQFAADPIAGALLGELLWGDGASESGC